MAIPDAKMRTVLGCVITVVEAQPGVPVADPLDAGGVLVVLAMDPPDSRQAEVYLSPRDVGRLHALLGEHLRVSQ